MNKITRIQSLLSLLALSILLILSKPAMAQETKRLVRLAKLEIDPAQLDNYNAALKEHAETALRVEPGVLVLYPMADAKQPTHITVLEIYASQEAYQAHLKAPHFLKYKTSTQAMVKALELVETVPLLPGLPEK